MPPAVLPQREGPIYDGSAFSISKHFSEAWTSDWDIRSKCPVTEFWEPAQGAKTGRPPYTPCACSNYSKPTPNPRQTTVHRDPNDYKNRNVSMSVFRDTYEISPALECCYGCFVAADEVSLLYWGEQTATTGKNLSLSDAISTMTLNGATFVSPSVYISFKNLRTQFSCPGFGYGYTSGTSDNTILPYLPHEVSTLMCREKTPATLRRYAKIDLLDYQLSATSIVACAKSIASVFRETRAVQGPYILLPEAITSINSEWASCTRVVEGILDPPSMLNPAGAIDGPNRFSTMGTPAVSPTLTAQHSQPSSRYQTPEPRTYPGKAHAAPTARPSEASTHKIHTNSKGQQENTDNEQHHSSKSAKKEGHLWGADRHRNDPQPPSRDGHPEEGSYENRTISQQPNWEGHSHKEDRGETEVNTVAIEGVMTATDNSINAPFPSLTTPLDQTARSVITGLSISDRVVRPGGIAIKTDGTLLSLEGNGVLTVGGSLTTLTSSGPTTITEDLTTNSPSSEHKVTIGGIVTKGQTARRVQSQGFGTQASNGNEVENKAIETSRRSPTSSRNVASKGKPRTHWLLILLAVSYIWLESIA